MACLPRHTPDDSGAESGSNGVGISRMRARWKKRSRLDLSLIHIYVTGYYNTGDRMKYWGRLGAVWGGFWGLLFGAAFFAIPGIGPVLVAGPLVAWIVGALEGLSLIHISSRVCTCPPAGRRRRPRIARASQSR